MDISALLISTTAIATFPAAKPTSVDKKWKNAAADKLKDSKLSPQKKARGTPSTEKAASTASTLR